MQDPKPTDRRKPLATHGRTIHSGQAMTGRNAFAWERRSDVSAIACSTSRRCRCGPKYAAHSMAPSVGDFAIDEKTGTDKHSQHSPAVNVSVNVVNVGECSNGNIHRENTSQSNGLADAGECCECFSHTHTRARAHAPAKEDTKKHSQHSPHSPDPEKPRVSNGECAGECRPGHSPIPNPPDWLKEVL